MHVENILHVDKVTWSLLSSFSRKNFRMHVKTDKQILLTSVSTKSDQYNAKITISL